MLVFYVPLFVLSWHFVLVLLVMFVLGIVFFVCSVSGFGFWCFDVNLYWHFCVFLLFWRYGAVLDRLSSRWVAVIFVVG